MKLRHLSLIAIAALLAGVVLLAATAVVSYQRMAAKQAEIADLLDLRERIDDFSVASDSMLLFPPDERLWQAYRRQAEGIQADLRARGDDHPDAERAVHRIDTILATLAATPDARAGEGVTAFGTEAMGISPRARALLNEVASQGMVLDTTVDEVLRARQQAIAREATWIAASFAGAAALFAALCVVAFTLIHRRVGRPVAGLHGVVRALREGDERARARVHGDDELAELGREFNRLADARQAADARIRQQQARLEQYQLLVDSASDMFCIIDASYRYVLSNDAYAALYGLDGASLEGRHLLDVLSRGFFEREVKPPIDRCFAGEPQAFEAERCYPQLGERRLLIRYYPIAGGDDSIPWVGAVVIDVTALRRHEQALHEQDRLLAMAGRIARLGGWSLDVDSDRVVWSDIVAEIHGMPRGYSPTREEDLAFYAPEYRARARRLFHACAEHGTPYDEELQVIDTAGNRVWVREAAEAVRDDTGRIYRVQGAYQDISAEKAGEQALLEAFELRQRLINALPAHICLIDGEGTILDANEQWRHYGRANDNPDPDFGVGRNYLAICDQASGECAKEAAQAAAGIRDVLAGRASTFALEYPCHSPHERRWFRLMANPLAGERVGGAVVMHVDITERKLAEDELNRLAFEDPLTGLLSRHGLVQAFNTRLESRDWPAGGCVIMLDVERQRDINDFHGFDVGDRCLVALAERLRAEAGEDAYIARTGGDEFVLLLPTPDARTAEQQRARVGAVFERPFRVGDAVITMDARFGYTEFGVSRQPVDALLRQAELALFSSREGGNRDRWARYSVALDKASRTRIQLTSELRRALSAHEFELHFQPKVELASGRMISGEALIRWNHPQRGLLSPAAFIGVAERSRLIAPIGDWVLREACRRLREWRDAGFGLAHVAVNVSLIQFIEGDFAAVVADVVDAFDIEPGALTLEITESVFEEESDRLLEQIRTLHDTGVRLSLDDFGTGYSSLRYLQRYPFDEIKIDQSFVRAMLSDDYSYRIVTTVMNLASALGAEAVAEGVETAELRDHLIALGCRIGQGYYYSMPLIDEDFRWLLDKRNNLPLEPHRSG